MGSDWADVSGLLAQVRREEGACTRLGVRVRNRVRGQIKAMIAAKR